MKNNQTAPLKPAARRILVEFEPSACNSINLESTGGKVTFTKLDIDHNK
jgi:hypothetical protein